MKNTFLFLSVLSSFNGLYILGKEIPKKPNLLFIVTDEHNYKTLSCYRKLLPKDESKPWGDGSYSETLNIDKIADRGVLFTRMYASSPVSSAVRASMFTGKYGAEVCIPSNSTKPGDGRYLHTDVKTIAQCLRDAGYYTGYAGKFHLAESKGSNSKEWWKPYPEGHEGYDYGFTDNRFMFNGGHNKYKGLLDDGTPYFAENRPTYIGKDKYGQSLFKDKKSSNVKGTTDFLTDRTLEFIDEHKDEPFYYVLSIPDPHTPDIAIKPYDDLFSSYNYSFPKTYSESKTSGMPVWMQPQEKARKLMSILPQYFGMVKNIDDNVGRILDKLEEDGILENTIIVFTADHGDMLGEHGRLDKGVIQDCSAKVPFVIAQGKKGANPNIPKGAVVNYAANTTDWMPTFLSLLGVKSPEVSGRNISPIMKAKVVKGWKDVTYSQLFFIAAIDSRYKLRISSAKNDKPWLFDNQKDQDEMKNYIDDPKYKYVKIRLAKDLRDFNIKHNKQNILFDRLQIIIDDLINN